MHPVQLFHWHFMAYPYLPPDFDERFDTGWVTVPNSLWDREKTDGLYQEYIDQLAEAAGLGSTAGAQRASPEHLRADAVAQHHRLGADPAHRPRQAGGARQPAAAHLNPLRVAEEYAMIDSISGGRLIAGFAVGGGPEAYNYNIPSPQSRQRFWEAVDLIVRTWTEDGPFEHEGPSYPLRYVNIWPKPRQTPHPRIWIPGALSAETMDNVAKRGFDYFLSSRTHGAATRQARERFADIVKRHGATPITRSAWRIAVGLCRRDRRAGQDRVGGGDSGISSNTASRAISGGPATLHLRPRRLPSHRCARGRPFWKTRPRRADARRCG